MLTRGRLNGFFFLYKDELFEVTMNCLSSWCIFNFMTNFLTSWRIFYFMTNIWRIFDAMNCFYMMTYFWQTFWSNNDNFVIMTCVYIMTNILTSGRTFWRPDVFWTNFLTSWYVFDIMTSWKVLAWHTFGRHDVMNFLTSWCVLYVMIRFWCHWRHNIFWLHDNFWLHDKLLTSWQTFDVMTRHD